MSAPRADLGLVLAAETKGSTEQTERALHNPGLAQQTRDSFAYGIINRAFSLPVPPIEGFNNKLNEWRDRLRDRSSQVSESVSALEFPPISMVVQVQASELDLLNSSAPGSAPLPVKRSLAPQFASAASAASAAPPATAAFSFGSGAGGAGTGTGPFIPSGLGLAPSASTFDFGPVPPLTFSFGAAPLETKSARPRTKKKQNYTGALSVGPGKPPIADITDTPLDESKELELLGFDSVGEALSRALEALRQRGVSKTAISSALIRMHSEQTPLAEIIQWVWSSSVSRNTNNGSNTGADNQRRRCDLLPALEYFAYCRTQRLCSYTAAGTAVCRPALDESVSHVLLLCVACLCLVTGWVGDGVSDVREERRNALVACLKQVDKGTLIVLDMFLRDSGSSSNSSNSNKRKPVFDVIDVLAHRLLHALASHDIAMIGSPIGVYMDSLFPTEFQADMQTFLRCEALAHAIVAQRSDRYNEDEHYGQFALHWRLYEEMSSLGASDEICSSLAASQSSLTKAVTLTTAAPTAAETAA